MSSWHIIIKESNCHFSSFCMSRFRLRDNLTILNFDTSHDSLLSHALHIRRHKTTSTSRSFQKHVWLRSILMNEIPLIFPRLHVEILFNFIFVESRRSRSKILYSVIRDYFPHVSHPSLTMSCPSYKMHIRHIISSYTSSLTPIVPLIQSV